MGKKKESIDLKVLNELSKSFKKRSLEIKADFEKDRKEIRLEFENFKTRINEHLLNSKKELKDAYDQVLKEIDAFFEEE